METGIKLIAIERQQQIEKHNRSVEHDKDLNKYQELRKGAVALLTQDFGEFPKAWSVNLCKKMINKEYKERLIMAGALIAAEIDRIQE